MLYAGSIGRTVLDWSVTPIAAPGFEFGDACRGLDLGLEPATRPERRPCRCSTLPPTWRTSRSATAPARSFNHCLCSPLLGCPATCGSGRPGCCRPPIPPLPPSLAFVDVILANVTPFVHVPVTPVGTAPVARRPTDLARPPASWSRRSATTSTSPTPSSPISGSGSRSTRVLAAPGRATLEWTLTSLDGQPRNRVARLPDCRWPARRRMGCRWSISAPPTGPCCASARRTGPCSGLAGRRRNNRTAYECLCTEIGLWAGGLRDPAVTSAW